MGSPTVPQIIHCGAVYDTYCIAKLHTHWTKSNFSGAFLFTFSTHPNLSKLKGVNLFWTDRVWSEQEYFFSSLFQIKSGADLEEVDLSSIERAPLPTDWSGPGWAGGEERGNCCHHNLSRAFLRKSNLQSRFSSAHKKENQSCIHLNTIAQSCLFFHLSYIIFPCSLSCSCLSGVVLQKKMVIFGRNHGCSLCWGMV